MRMVRDSVLASAVIGLCGFPSAAQMISRVAIGHAPNSVPVVSHATPREAAILRFSVVSPLTTAPAAVTAAAAVSPAVSAAAAAPRRAAEPAALQGAPATAHSSVVVSSRRSTISRSSRAESTLAEAAGASNAGNTFDSSLRHTGNVSALPAAASDSSDSPQKHFRDVLKSLLPSYSSEQDDRYAAERGALWKKKIAAWEKWKKENPEPPAPGTASRIIARAIQVSQAAALGAWALWMTQTPLIATGFALLFGFMYVLSTGGPVQRTDAQTIQNAVFYLKRGELFEAISDFLPTKAPELALALAGIGAGVGAAMGFGHDIVNQILDGAGVGFFVGISLPLAVLAGMLFIGLPIAGLIELVNSFRSK